MAKKKLALAILWHQHQPYYKNSSGIFQMPWVRFHSTKDYLDMLLVLKEFPSVKQNFNLVPSLLSQIRDYAINNSGDNIWSLAAIKAEELSLEDKKKILSNFFLLNINNMVKPYPRYYELYMRFKVYLKTQSLEKRVAAFSSQDFIDLQVWYNLAWIGMESRKRPEIEKLFKKGMRFTEEDKQILFSEIRRIMGEILPLHKEMWDAGQIELSTSPFYHPILPLLCDTQIATQSSPGIALPIQHFAHPEDAERQVENGLNYFSESFGRRPAGMWPSEGSVSLQTLEIIARQGIVWVATDEGILANSLRKDYNHSRIYQPYQLTLERNRINIFFRDHYLSDAIGFVYANWPADRSVEDFMGRIRAIRKLLVENYSEDILSRFVIPIVLDGENCWEYYEGDGKPFLRQLYSALSQDDLIETVTFSEVLQRNKNPENLPKLFPGSWINSNFNIWIGSEEDNKAWDILSQTREFLVKQEKAGHFSEETIRKAWEKIYIAEGSDWNWWYGEEHSTANDTEFDQLYREHLMEIYRLLGQEIPTVLYQTIKRTHFDRFVVTRPKNFINPKIDGHSSYFYEWVGAAVYEISRAPQSAMHQVTRLLDQLYVGFNVQKLFIRLDFLEMPDPLTEFVLAARRPYPVTIVISPLRGVIQKFEMQAGVQNRSNLKPEFALGKILEAAIPFADLGVKPGDLIGFQILVKLNNQSVEEYPRSNLIEVQVPHENFDLIEWSV